MSVSVPSIPVKQARFLEMLDWLWVRWFTAGEPTIPPAHSYHFLLGSG